MFENPRRGGQARNFTTNIPKILDLNSSSLGAPGRSFEGDDDIAQYPSFKHIFI